MSVSLALVTAGTPTVGFADEAGSEQGDETPTVVVDDNQNDAPSQDNGGSDQPADSGDTPSTPEPPAPETPSQDPVQEPSQEQPEAPEQDPSQGQNNNTNNQSNASQGGTSSSSKGSSSNASSGSQATSSKTGTSNDADTDSTDDKSSAKDKGTRVQADNSDIYASCSKTARYLAKELLGIDLKNYNLIAQNYTDLARCANGEYKVGKTPKPNSLAVWAAGGSNSSGHVAFVESVSADGTTMHIIEGGWHRNGNFSAPGERHEADVPTSGSEYGYQYGGNLVGFIYLLEPVNGPSSTLTSAEGGAGTITVAGSAAYANGSSKGVKVQFYDGPIASGTMIGSLTTDSYGSFKKKLTVTRRGSFTLYAYVLDSASGNSYQMSGTFKVKVTEPKGDAITSLAEGTYAIRSRLNSSKSLDIKKASKSNTANAMVYTWGGKLNQLYNVVKNSDGTYTLVAEHSGKVIEVRKCSVEEGANVDQYTSNNGANQKWWLDQNDNGTYTLRNQLSGQVLEVKGSKANNGTNVQQNPSKGWKRQMWYFVPTDVSQWSVTAADVEYDTELGGPATTKVTVKAGGVTLNEGTDYTAVYQNNNALGTAAVTIIGKNGFSGMKMATFNITESAKLSGQTVKPSWKGPSSIPVGSVCAYTVSNGAIKVKSGASLVSVVGPYIQAKKKGTVTLALVNEEGTEVATKELKIEALKGTYEIQTALNSNYVLDIQKGSKEDNANIIVYTRTSKKNQQYQFELQSDGTYAIKCVHSGKYLDVLDGSAEEGMNVIQYAKNAKSNQHWMIQVDASGRVTFASAKSGLCFNVNGGKAVKGRKITQVPATDGKAQKWVLNKV